MWLLHITINELSNYFYFILLCSYKSDSDSEQSYTNVSCSDQSNYKDHGPLHLLRCQGNIQQQKCSQDPVYLVCGSQVDTPGQ